MKFSAATLVLVLSIGASAFGQTRPKTAQIITQVDAPVEIRGHTQIDQRNLARPDQTSYDTRFVNRSPKRITAVEFTVVMFSLFNEFMAQVAGLNAPDSGIPSGPQVQTASWESSRTRNPYLTAVIYVSRVRFEDGQIWKANPASVIGELKKIDPDIDPAIFKKTADDR